jgi:hypothetical protein
MVRLASESPTRVEQIQELLDKIEEIQDEHDNGVKTPVMQGLIKSMDSYLESSVTFQDNVKSIIDGNRLENLRRFRQRIRRWLDPHNYLVRYNGVGRAVDGT